MRINRALRLQIENEKLKSENALLREVTKHWQEVSKYKHKEVVMLIEAFIRSHKNS